MVAQFSFQDVRYSPLNRTSRNKRLWTVVAAVCIILGISVIYNQYKEESIPPRVRPDCSAIDPRINEKRKVVGDQWIVVTTINPPTDAMDLLCNLQGWNVVVVADTKSPKEWKCGSCVYLSVEEQQCLHYSIVDVIPYRAYTRKNIGYLWAIQQGATKVFDTDDDNLPTGKDIFVESPTAGVVGYRSNSTGKSVNIYSHFGRPDIWPRGFPLEDIDIRRPVSYMREYESLPEEAKNALAPPVLVQQGLADLDPDVDAIFRLTQVQELTHAKFCKKSPSIRLSPGTFCPFNSQNTLFRYDALWGLLLPVTVSFRVCDIWRGYWVQRLLWDVNGSLGFTKPTVDQIRNAHDYLDDYRDELQIYAEASRLIDYLASWTSWSSDLGTRIVRLMEGMAEHKFIEEADVDLAKRWVHDLRSVGYVFPKVHKYNAKTQQDLVSQHEERRLHSQSDRRVANEALRQCQAEEEEAAKAGHTVMSSRIQITETPKKDLYSTAFKNILLVVNFNHPDYAAIEPFLAIYQGYFPNIQFYGPKVPDRLKHLVSEVPYDKGYTQYRSIADAIERFPSYKGYMYTNDDTLLNVFQLAELDPDKIWKEVPDPIRDVHDISQPPPDSWTHWTNRKGDALWQGATSFTAEQRARIAKFTKVQGPVNVRAYSDAVYVPARVAKELAGVLREFVKYDVFLEVALGLALVAVDSPENWVNWKETYLWERERRRWREYLQPGLGMMHPVKMISDRKAKDDMLQWLETVEVVPHP